LLKQNGWIGKNSEQTAPLPISNNLAKTKSKQKLSNHKRNSNCKVKTGAFNVYSKQQKTSRGSNASE